MDDLGGDVFVVQHQLHRRALCHKDHEERNIELPEYASSSVVVVEPQAARPTAKPEAMASFARMPGFFCTTS